MSRQSVSCCDLLKIHYLCGDKDNSPCSPFSPASVVICSKFITFAVTKTTWRNSHQWEGWLWFAQNSLPLRWQRQRLPIPKGRRCCCDLLKIHYLCGDKDNGSNFLIYYLLLWFAQNSLPLRWQRQHNRQFLMLPIRCDLLKIHYLCGDKDNCQKDRIPVDVVVICSKFITFAVTKTTISRLVPTSWQLWFAQNSLPLRWQRQPMGKIRQSYCRCDLLKIHYLCGDKDNLQCRRDEVGGLWFAQNSLPLRWQRQPCCGLTSSHQCCDLLKIHYLCGDKDNRIYRQKETWVLWFAQNSLPLRWQRQLSSQPSSRPTSCDLLKIHYLCGDKDNLNGINYKDVSVVICSKFITFAVTKTTRHPPKACSS